MMGKVDGSRPKTVGSEAFSALCMSPLHHLAVPHLAEAHLSENGPRETQSALCFTASAVKEAVAAGDVATVQKAWESCVFFLCSTEGIQERT